MIKPIHSFIITRIREFITAQCTGNDNIITIVIWPKENENSRLVGNISYHHDWIKSDNNSYFSNSQLIVTNRIIREVILHFGVQKITNNRGQMNVGSIEEIDDVDDTLRN